jgi:hypothetical protein
MPINYLALKALRYYGTTDISLIDVIEKVEIQYNIENMNLSNKKKRKNNDRNSAGILAKSNEIFDDQKFQKKRALDIYHKLRKNIQNTVLNSYHDTGFFWEHYTDTEGQGTRGHPFTGWTALIINIMSDKY